MSPLLLNAIVVIAALVIVLGVWSGVHLLARKRMGPRQIGCRGPSTDAQGNEVCCTTGEACDRESGNEKSA